MQQEQKANKKGNIQKEKSSWKLKMKTEMKNSVEGLED